MNLPNTNPDSAESVPDENHDDEISSERFGELLKIIKFSDISKDDALDLDYWLWGNVLDRIEDQRVELLVSTQTSEEQINFYTQTREEQIHLCSKLEDCALLLSSHFDFLTQTSSINLALSHAFNTIFRTRRNLNDPGNEWLRFREQLNSDAASLAQVAKQTRAHLEMSSGRKGREVQTWRNMLFTELLDRLLQISGKSQFKSTPVAYKVWNLYFPDEKIMSEDAATQIIRRNRNRQKSQGH
jgi:hypothetical protein